MRYAAFFLGVLAGVLELAGAILGLGIAGIGFVFGADGPLPPSMGVGIAITCGVASIFAATAIMFVRDARPLGLLLVGASVGAAICGGPWAVPGAIAGLLAAWLALRLDLSRPVY